MSLNIYIVHYEIRKSDIWEKAKEIKARLQSRSVNAWFKASNNRWAPNQRHLDVSYLTYLADHNFYVHFAVCCYVLL